MPTPILITDQLQRVLNQAARGLTDTAPLTNIIATQLLSQTQQNYRSMGRPRWRPLSPATITDYKRRGISTDGILRRTHSLYNSVQKFSTADSASISAGGGNQASKYAAIHQFGGWAGIGRKIYVPARPYLPIDNQGSLQDEAAHGISEVVLLYLQGRFSG
ncbi:phage virion morphogenesis protein [Psychrobacter pygoscelis]|uniref:phage virion morphogenesis protein n=1 Tax=Psychrobacter pygoscelis TaxID=2488563 RepID=UPI00103A6E1E|nr:phage virion morphogenesis protein [Psychrobacter pygoscelis]